MTDYVKSTNFTSKDSLPSGNALKIIKGTEFDVEFNNIAVAITSKAETTSPAFAGIPTAPTAASGTSTTQIATTAFVTTALQALYPVGSVYINAGASTNPATLLGFGTWVAFGAGRVMVGLNGSDPLFDVLEETGGSKDAIVVSHTHTASSSSTFTGNALPTHSHSIPSVAVVGDSSVGAVRNVGNDTTSSTTTAVSAGTPSGSVSTTTTVNSAGSSGTNANLQPYVTVAMWKRTA